MRLSILGSTGSIGCNTLQVVREMEGRAAVGALAAGRNVAELASQIREFQPELVSVADDAVRAELVEALGGGRRPEILVGQEGLLACVTDVDCGAVVSAAVGVVGLPATYEAVRRGKRVALANKEVLVAAGELVMAAARESGAELLPVDSEHNALHQCLRAGRYEEVERLILTASGGPFRRTPRAELESVTPEQALRHPTWRMGARITIDSSTLMNKGFEVIEACLLFGFGADRVQVVVHPQSIVHAMVEYRDGSVIAQLGPPDMKLPIRYALTDPAREAGPPERRLHWDAVRNLEFEPPDFDKFPLLRLAFEAAEAGGGAGCVLNAADEIAVAAFLAREIPYTAIAAVVGKTLERYGDRRASSLEDVAALDREARAAAKQISARMALSVS